MKKTSLQQKKLHGEFFRKFAVPGIEKTKPASFKALTTAQKLLGIVFPDAFKTFSTTYGAAYTPDILEMIADLTPEHPDLREFWKVSELFEANQLCWKGGMPMELVAFANDCMGSMFCFRRGEKSDDTVQFFDHDYCRVYKIADDFDSLLAWYVNHL